MWLASKRSKINHNAKTKAIEDSFRNYIQNSAITAMLLTLPELDLPVVLSDLYLEHLEADDVGRQTTETLPPAASNSNQQHVATRLGNNTDYAGHCAERNEYVSQIDH